MLKVRQISIQRKAALFSQELLGKKMKHKSEVHSFCRVVDNAFYPCFSVQLSVGHAQLNTQNKTS